MTADIKENRQKGSRLIAAAREALDWLLTEHDHQQQSWHGDYRTVRCDESCGDAPAIIRELREAIEEAERK